MMELQKALDDVDATYAEDASDGSYKKGDLMIR